MTKQTKILLTLPLFLGLLYQLAFIYPKEFIWLIPTMTAYYWQVGFLNMMGLGVLIFVLRRIWKFQLPDNSRKTFWTLVILFTGPVILVYIWKIDDELKLEEDKFLKTMPNNLYI